MPGQLQLTADYQAFKHRAWSPSTSQTTLSPCSRHSEPYLGGDMEYDFDRVVNRMNTDSAKWDAVESVFGSSEVLPMWVADMDFPVARPITEALKNRVDHEVYGYTRPGPSLVDAIIDRVKQKYGWVIQPEWIVFTPGVVPALHVAIRALTRPGDEVIIQGPVYYPFWSAITNSGCVVANSQLQLAAGRYQMDFDDLERKFGPGSGMMSVPSRARALILCSPHNPVGRVWTREELTRLGDITLRNDATVISDDVHCELLFKGTRHTPFASISPEFEQHSITCMSASKTFNVAGLGASAIIIPNERLRRAFETTRAGILPRPSILAFTAFEAAFRFGDEWLGQLLNYLQGNLDFLMDYFDTRIEEIRPIRPEGTYLVWLDCRQLGLDSEELRRFMREKARLGLDDGYLFGPSGAGFQRMNIACPRATLVEALRRLEEAVHDLKR